MNGDLKALGFAVIAGGHLRGGLDDTDAGFVEPNVNGAVATWGGLNGGWEIIPNEFPGDEDAVLLYSGAPGSRVDGLSISSSSVGTPQTGFGIYCNRIVIGAPDDVSNIPISVPVNFLYMKRPRKT